MKKNQSWTFFLVLIVVGVAAWYFNKNFISNLTDQNTAKIDQKNAIKMLTEKLIFATTSSTGNTISSIDANGKTQILFTDAGDAVKIKTIGTLSQDSLEVPVIFDKNLLFAVKLDGSSGKQSLAEFTADSPDVALSPDGKLISYITFSNVEKEYGFTLKVADRNGKNLKQILTSPYLLSNPVWATDQKSVYYVENNGSNISIVKTQLETAKEQKIYTTGENIGSLRVMFGQILFSKNPEDKNESTLFAMTETSPAKSILTEKGSIYYPSISSDGKNIAYLLRPQASITTTGDIKITNTSGKNTKTLIKGINILGWLP